MSAKKPLTLEGAQVRQLQAGETLQAQASMSGAASLNLPEGTAPASPADGDVWTTSAGMFVRIAGVTIGPLGTGGGSASVAPLVSGTSAGGLQLVGNPDNELVLVTVG